MTQNCKMRVSEIRDGRYKLGEKELKGEWSQEECGQVTIHALEIHSKYEMEIINNDWSYIMVYWN